MCINHIQYDDFSIYTHRNHYVTEISEISLNTTDTANPDTPLAGTLLTLFWIPLGAVSWLQQTRADIAPLVGYLQRIAHKPTIHHAKLVNKILRYI